MDLLRHGAMGTLFGGVRVPSTLGPHLRSYTWGNVSQLEKAGREFLAELARRAPPLPGAGTLAFIDIDSMQKRVNLRVDPGRIRLPDSRQRLAPAEDDALLELSDDLEAEHVGPLTLGAPGYRVRLFERRDVALMAA